MISKEAVEVWLDDPVTRAIHEHMREQFATVERVAVRDAKNSAVGCEKSGEIFRQLKSMEVVLEDVFESSAEDWEVALKKDEEDE